LEYKISLQILKTKEYVTERQLHNNFTSSSSNGQTEK